MKATSQWQIHSPTRLFCAMLLTCGLACSAKVLDNFDDNFKTDWADTLSGGSVSETAQQLQITTAGGTGVVTSSKKTSETFTPTAGHTLELRVDVNTVSPADNTNVLTVLAWVPTGSALFGNGYSVVAGAATVQLRKGATALWATNFTSAIQNSNVTLVLRLTPSGSAMSVNARVYKQTGNQQLQNFTVLAEYTVTDAAGLVGVAGQATLGVLNQASATGVSARFDNLQVYDLSNGVLDNFNTADGMSGWGIAKKNTADVVDESGGQAVCRAYLAAGGGFATAYYTAKTFQIVDGARVEFRVTLVNNTTLNNTYSLLGYLPSPGAGGQNIYSLLLYHIAHRYFYAAGGSTALANGKNYNGWWSTISPSPDVQNMLYSLAMTGEGQNLRIETRIEDLNKPLNSPERVVYQNVFLDTPAKDITGEAIDAPYLNVAGNFTIGVFNDGAFPPAYAEVIFDNAEYSETIPANAPPSILNVSPTHLSNFVASASAVTFTVLDDTNTPVDNIALTLNGVVYTNGSPGVSITGSEKSRVFTLTGALAPNVNYAGSIRATDNAGETTELPYMFDTFLTNCFVVESEEYNFNSGSFIDDPLLIQEGTTDVRAYNDQLGTAEIDFHDNQTYPGGGQDVHTFRYFDPVRTGHAGDPPRAKYILAGGPELGFYEQMIDDIRDGDWLNYTKTYPAGTYNVYLRQSQYLLPQTLVTLERVTSDRTQPNQTTRILGSFLGSISGLDRYANVALTDGAGQPVVVRFTGGVDTLRVHDRITGNANDEVGIILQNYLVFVPATDPGTLRPVMALATPLPGATVSDVAPATTATIVNRDTSVNTGSVLLLVNGNAVAATVTPTTDGATVNYAYPSPPPPPGTVTNTLLYQDSEGVWQTNTWTWNLNYPLLRAANALPVGALTLRGWELRLVQTNGPTLGNNLARAEQQLALPPAYPAEFATQTVWQVVNWNDAGDGFTAMDFGYFTGATGVPGLPPDSTHENIACELFAYLELTAGVHRFGAVSDDGFQLRSGTGLRDALGTVLGARDGGTFNGTFDFVAEATGLYPVRCVWYENGGGANFQLFSVDLNNPNNRVLINDPANPTGVVKAWLPYGLLAASSVTGPFTGAAGHVIDTATKTITVPRAGDTQFYRVVVFDPLNPSYQPAITSIQVGPTTVTIQYQ